MLKKEMCKNHTWKGISFICSCKEKLCIHCLKEHNHENMHFISIEDYYLSFEEHLRNMKRLLSMRRKDFYPKEDEVYDENLSYQMMSLEKVSLWIDKYLDNPSKLYSLTTEQIDSFLEKNFTKKLSELILTGLNYSIEENQKKLEQKFSLGEKSENCSTPVKHNK